MAEPKPPKGGSGASDAAPDDHLSMLEAIADITGCLEQCKQMLVDQGWSERMAEQAAITTVGGLIGTMNLRKEQ